LKDERPLYFFGLAGFLTGAIGIVLGLPLIATHLETGLVPRFPTATLAVGLIILPRSSSSRASSSTWRPRRAGR
jgi:hypothetical protein